MRISVGNVYRSIFDMVYFTEAYFRRYISQGIFHRGIFHRVYFTEVYFTGYISQRYISMGIFRGRKTVPGPARTKSGPTEVYFGYIS